MTPKKRNLLIAIFTLILAIIYFVYVYQTGEVPGMRFFGLGDGASSGSRPPIHGVILLAVSILFFRNSR